MIRTVLAAAVAAAFSMGAASAATVFSDNFNAEVYGTPQTALTKWKITAGSIDVIGSPSYGWCGAGQGNCLDMNGSTGTAGRIETVLKGLIVGATYQLTFDFGNNQNTKSAFVAEVLSFGFGATSYSLSIFSQPAMTASSVYSFVAANSKQTLFFADTGTTPGDNGGPLLDNVRLSVVPLPAGGLLLLGALGGIAALRRRKSV